MRATARMPKLNPRPSLRPVLLPVGGPFEDEYKCRGRLLEEMYMAVESGVAPWDATILGW